MTDNLERRGRPLNLNSFERLESRYLLAITVSFANDELLVASDANPDEAYVGSEVAGGQRCPAVWFRRDPVGAPNWTGQTANPQVPIASVKKVRVDGGPGDATDGDWFSLQGVNLNYTGIDQTNISVFGIGGKGNDTIGGSLFSDSIVGGEGADSIGGGAGGDVLKGDEHGDTVYGDEGVDVIFGGDGWDDLNGGPDNDEIRGGPGNDGLFGGISGNDTLYGEDGNDTLEGSSSSSKLYGDDSSP